ncbi:uncharacterized protein [Montipora capricornis]|uniref:uncharacterized protein n=1 Tax=Montipora capricornis TaxID=246305 RepID=UPI0035F1056E
MECNTGTVLGSTNRRLSTRQKLPKRVSFKDETLIIHIPSREDSPSIWRESRVLNKETVEDTSGENFSDSAAPKWFGTLSSASLFANDAQRSRRTTQIRRSSSLGEKTEQPVHRPVLKTYSATQRGNTLNRTYRPITRREMSDVFVSSRYSLNDWSIDGPTAVEKSGLTNQVLDSAQPQIHSSPSRGLRKEESLLNQKTQRFLSLDVPFKRISYDTDRRKAPPFANQSQMHLNIVGVTYEGVDKNPYFCDISHMDNIRKRSPATNLPNDRMAFRHSSVSTVSQVDSRKGTRHFSAIPTFNKKSHETREYPANTWKIAYDYSSPARLPIAWQANKRYNFSTK